MENNRCFNNITKEDGTQANLIKLIRNESIGNYSWSDGINQWENSTIMKLLNNKYFNDFFYNNSRNAIEGVNWNIAGTTTSNILYKEFYQFERGTTTYDKYNTKWLGKVGLIYPSDYGYATSGGFNLSRKDCLNLSAESWHETSAEDCRVNNYLFDEGYYYWTMTLVTSDKSSVFRVDDNGHVCDALISWSDFRTYPSLYLKADILITGGTGSSEEPYMLGL